MERYSVAMGELVLQRATMRREDYVKLLAVVEDGEEGLSCSIPEADTNTKGMKRALCIPHFRHIAYENVNSRRT